ncbi:BRO family protein [Yersinia intermedia]|uniref:BRO family protein n=1 Tax=Yersinia intermedia TaxID=631 RepID=UPI0005E5F631|nr:BRO family protein [Yersinia intermedia]CNI24975.1 BRO family%2C N-terminal domain [Yersinia intermedia]
MKKLNALIGSGQTHSEFSTTSNSVVLRFKDQTVIPFDHGDGKIWVTAKESAKLLGYANAKSVTNLYNSNSDEFTASMTEVITTVTSGKTMGCNNLKTKIRIFSLRGLHLLGLLAETPVAKDLRRWALDLMDKESGGLVADTRLTLQQMQNIVATAWKTSNEDSSDAGRRLRKRQDDLPVLQKAQKLVDEIGQIPFEFIGGGKLGIQ